MLAWDLLSSFVIRVFIWTSIEAICTWNETRIADRKCIVVILLTLFVYMNDSKVSGRIICDFLDKKVISSIAGWTKR